MTEVVTTAWNLGAAGSINGYPIDGEYVAKWNPQCCFKCKMVDAKGSNEGVSTPVMFLTAEMWSPRYENTFYTIKMEKFELISSPQEWMKAPSLIKGKTSFPAYYYKIDVCCGHASHSVLRRYSEFVWLRKTLESTIQIPEMPPGTCFFQAQDDKFAQNRLEQLRDFLEGFLQCPGVSSDTAVVSFLELTSLAT